MQQGVAAERAYRQSHQEGEQELEAGLVEDGDQHHAQQRQQADDGDGHEARQPHVDWQETQENTRVGCESATSHNSFNCCGGSDI